MAATSLGRDPVPSRGAPRSEARRQAPRPSYARWLSGKSGMPASGGRRNGAEGEKSGHPQRSLMMIPALRITVATTPRSKSVASRQAGDSAGWPVPASPARLRTVWRSLRLVDMARSRIVRLAGPGMSVRASRAIGNGLAGLTASRRAALRGRNALDQAGVPTEAVRTHREGASERWFGEFLQAPWRCLG